MMTLKRAKIILYEFSGNLFFRSDNLGFQKNEKNVYLGTPSLTRFKLTYEPAN